MGSWHQSALTVLDRNQSPYFLLDYSNLGIADFEYFYQKLSQKEKLHANSLRVGKDLYVATRASLRTILEEMFEIAPIIESGAFEKPYATNIACEFNVSHSASTALIALGGAEAVGADLEFIKRVPDLMEVAKIAFNHREQKIFTESGYVDEIFYPIWVRKEAALKAFGFGIADGLSDYYLEEKSRHEFILQREGVDGGMDVSIVDLPVEAGFIGALASVGSHMDFVRIGIDVRHHLLKNPVFAGSN